MSNFFLDGKEIPFERGQDILTAATNAGEFIPHFCAHPALSRAATCRMCLVDIVDAGNGRGMPKLQTACSTPAAENMKVESNNEKVKKARESVMEFLLVNHPLDCPICDQAGECLLQDYSVSYGSGKSTFPNELEKRVYGPRDIGTFLFLERNRCIHCTRCVRFTREISKTNEMGIYNRGHQLTVDTFVDSPLSDLFQGNLADICPVGAITSRDFRFRKRVWKLQKTPSICTGCSTGCNIEIHHHQGKIYRFKPRENQAVNRWWMCDPGRISFHKLLDKNTRQLGNAIEGKPATLESALERAAGGLKQVAGKKGTNIVIGSNLSTNEELYALKVFAENYLGQAKIIGVDVPKEKKLSDNFLENLISPDKAPNSKGLELLGFENQDAKTTLANLNWNEVGVLIVVGTAHDSDLLKEALQKSSFSILVTPFKNELSDVANVTFASQTHLEKTGTFINKSGRIQQNMISIKGFPESHSECVIFESLEKKLQGDKLQQKTLESLLGEMVEKIPSFSALKGKKLSLLGEPLNL